MHVTYKSLFLSLILPLAMAPSFTFAKDVAASQELSSPTFISFQCLNMNFRSTENLDEVTSVLRKNSVIQLPPGITVHRANGSVDLAKTIKNWVTLSNGQKEHEEFYHHQPRYRDCSNSKSTNCSTSGEEVYLPVKVVHFSDPKLNGQETLASNKAYGYLALDWLQRNSNPNCYKTETTSLETILKRRVVAPSEAATTNAAPEGGSETTSPAQAKASTEVVSTSNQGWPHAINNCNNTLYRSSNYTRHSCLKNKSLKQKAELVMKDVIAINKKRSGLNIDPRVSACMAYRESQFSPNARGGTPDWGMYQVIDKTGRYVIRKYRPVVPGFKSLRNNWSAYRKKMLKSTLAQADLHHSVLQLKASENKLVKRLNRSPTNSDLYQKLATRYNGGGARAARYGRKIRSCYDAMKKIADRNGKIKGSSRQLKAALRKAKD